MNNNKFLTLLIGHEWEEPNDEINCQSCGWSPFPDYISDPLPVIRWMERNMPGVWERYLKEQAASCAYAVTDNMLAKNRYYTRLLNLQIDLSELVSYLSEHREWGVKKCPQVNCKSPECRENPECGGTGKFKHPALVYLEEQCEK